jgi:hypothetical protein
MPEFTCLRLLARAVVPETEEDKQTRMSFADIHPKRQVKEAQSYVGSSPKPTSTTTLPLVEAPQKPLYGALPPSVDIRTTSERGRGLYAKERVKKGK